VISISFFHYSKIPFTVAIKVLSHCFIFSSVRLMQKHAQKWGEREMTKASGVADI